MKEKITIERNEFNGLLIPKPKSVASIGSKPYRTILPVDQHFNWFQKLMWKWCFGIKVEDYSEE